jgi:predicted XRE-type DNA-binding protein
MEQSEGYDEMLLRGQGPLPRKSGSAIIAVRGGTDTKARLCDAISRIVSDKQLTQPAAAKLLGINQPKVSALLNKKLTGFSVERLMLFLVSLQHEVVIQVTPQSPTTIRSHRRSKSKVASASRKSRAKQITSPPVAPASQEIAVF